MASAAENNTQVRQRQAADVSMVSADIHPRLREIYRVRGALADDDVALELSGLLRPDRMLGIDRGVALLGRALEQQARILIVGDFDADGATSTALLKLGLQAMGFRQVSYLVPNRFEYGYGLTPEIVATALERKPDMLITVDNGIASIEGVRLAREQGLEVLVTDHHLPGSVLPDASCIINPNQQGCPFPSKALAGVGVVFYLLLALRQELRSKGVFSAAGMAEPNMGALLDIVALGTVADVVPLDRNNRCLVRHGLRVIRNGQCRPGILALLAVAGRDFRRVNAGDLGFALGPRLNAAGRLEDMSLGIECLLTESPAEAHALASRLDDLNRERRLIETDMQQQAVALLERMPVTQQEQQAGICLYDTGWHQGVIGILASRIRERYHRPVIVFADSTENAGDIKGSARSVPGLHIRDLLDRLATSRPDLLYRFGGHAMAAGLSIRKADFADFARAFEQVLQEVIDPASLEPVVYVDGELDSELLNLEFARLLEDAGPWGQGFPEPLFSGRFRVVSQRILAAKHLKLTLAADEEGGQLIDGVAFNVPEQFLVELPEELSLVYRLQVNEFRGREEAQLLIEQIMPGTAA